MPLNRACSLDALRENIATELEAGRTRDQAVAIAYSTLREACAELSLPVPSEKDVAAVAREFKRKGGSSREYLEEALKEAQRKLPGHVYAQLHQAARSRAGGRISARHRATSVEKALVFGTRSLSDAEMSDALARVREMVGADIRLGRLASVGKVLQGDLEIENQRRRDALDHVAKNAPGSSDVHVDSTGGGSQKPKKKLAPGAVEVEKADRSKDPGVMIALRLPTNTANAIALGGENAEPPEKLHVTLAYLGRMSQVGSGGIAAATEAIAAVCGVPILRGALAGVGRFAGTESSDGKDVVIGLVDVPGLTDLRYRLVMELLARGVVLPSKHDYTPHVTLAYVAEGAPTPRLDERLRLRDIYFDKIVLAVNDADTVFPLAQHTGEVAPGLPDDAAIAFAKNLPVAWPSYDAEVVEVDGDRVFVAKGSDVEELAGAPGIDFEPGDIASVSAEGVTVSKAVEPSPEDVVDAAIATTLDTIAKSPIAFDGPDDARVVFVAAAPSDLEAARREAFVGEDGVAFAQRYLAPLCLTKSQVAVGFAVPILPDPPTANATNAPPDSMVSPEQLSRWAFWLDDNLARWPTAKVVAVGKAAKLALGDRAHVTLPHPSNVRRYDSGEVARKMRAFAKSLDGDVSIRHDALDPASPSTGSSGRVAEVIGELKAAGQVQVRISKAADEERIVYGVVLDPYQVDAQDDWTPPAEIKDTATGFLARSRVMGVEHQRRAGEGTAIVESWLVPYPSQKDYQLAKANRPHKAFEMQYGEDNKVHSGAWIAGVKLGDAEWAAYKRGELDAFSIGGFSFKTKVPKSAMPKVEFITLPPMF